MSRILILGATGFLGGWLSEHLKSLNHEVISHGYSSRSDINCDLSNLSQVRSLIAKVAPDVIINLVALTNVDYCEVHPNEASLINITIVENIVSVIEENQSSTYLVQISTDMVYDHPGENDEGNICIRNIYALTKLQGEEVAQRINSVVLRTNFFGHHKKCPNKGLVGWIIESLKEEKNITVFDDIFFSPVSIATLCDLIALVIDGRISGIYNLGSWGGMSKAEFARKLAFKLCLPFNYMHPSPYGLNIDTPVSRPRDMRMSMLKIESSLRIKLPCLDDEINKFGELYV